MSGWEWWLKSDAGLAARIAVGLVILGTLATVDLKRHGQRATRWREYLFLLAAVLLAMGYGVVNDWLASGISWEYFYYGKGLDQQLGPHVPPDPAALRWAACLIGLKSTWSAGLVIGVALLIANNPRRGRLRLPYQSLLGLLPPILLIAAGSAAVGAIIGSHGWLAWTNRDLRVLMRDNLFRPRAFMTAYGMNLGGYAGGLLATALATIWIVRNRWRPTNEH